MKTEKGWFGTQGRAIRPIQLQFYGCDRFLYTDLYKIKSTFLNLKSSVPIDRLAGSSLTEVASRSGKAKGEELGF